MVNLEFDISSSIPSHNRPAIQINAKYCSVHVKNQDLNPWAGLRKDIRVLGTVIFTAKPLQKVAVLLEQSLQEIDTQF